MIQVQLQYFEQGIVTPLIFTHRLLMRRMTL